MIILKQKHIIAILILTIFISILIALHFTSTNIENKLFTLSMSFVLYLCVISYIFFSFYFFSNQPIEKKISYLYSSLFIFFFLHLMLTFPFLLLSIAEENKFTSFQKLAVTGMRSEYTLTILTILIFLHKNITITRTKDNTIFYGFLFSILISSLISVKILNVKIIYLFNSFLPFWLILILLYFFLIEINNNSVFRKSFYLILNQTYFILIAILLGIYSCGFILYFNSWEGINFEHIYSLKGYELLEGFPRSWWFPLGDKLYFRFVALVDNPITSGYISSLICITALSKRYWFIFIFFLISCILSFSKGSMLLLFSCTFFGLFYTIFPSLTAKMSKKLLSSVYIFIIIILFLVALVTAMMQLTQTSADIHWLGLTLPFLHIQEYTLTEFIFGHGIGSGGNFLKGAMGSENISFMTWLKSGSESGIGTIFYQIGLCGLFFFVLAYLKVYKLLQAPYCKIIMIVYFFNLLLQENLLNLNILILLFFSIIMIEIHYLNKREIL